MDIGIVVATPTEMKALDNAFKSSSWKQSIDGMNVRIYRLDEHRIYAVESGAGEIKAAAATQLLITGCCCRLIANFGVCGALAPGMPVGQPAIVLSAVHYDRDVSAVDNCKPAVYEEFGSIHIPATPRLVNAAIASAPLYPVACASGDRFIDGAKAKRAMYLTYGTEICDMEAAGILLTANRAGVPALLIKAVSDGSTGGANDYWNTVDMVAANCAETLLTVLRDWRANEKGEVQ